MFARRAALMVLVACVAACGASCAKKEKGIKVQSRLAARVADYKISEEAMNRRLDELPDAQRREFAGPKGKAEFVDRLIDQHLLYKAAMDAKIDREEEVQERMRWVTMNLVVAEYFERNIGKKVEVDEAEIERYYRDHQEEFRKAPVMRAQYLLSSDSLKAVSWRKRILAGENMTQMAQKESEDKTTAREGGDVGYFNPGEYVRGVGRSEIFGREVGKLDVGELSDVFRFERGFAIARVSEKNPEGMQTLDEARRLIEAKIRASKTEELLKGEVERLKKKYESENYVRERLEKEKRTPEELWEMAQMEGDPRARIQFYRDIVSAYPTDARSPEALFMIGFTYAEDLKEFVQARRTFDELIKTYPKSTVIESATWMIENMSKPGMQIDSPEDVQRRMEEGKTRGEGGS